MNRLENMDLEQITEPAIIGMGVKKLEMRMPCTDCWYDTSCDPDTDCNYDCSCDTYDPCPNDCGCQDTYPCIE